MFEKIEIAIFGLSALSLISLYFFRKKFLIQKIEKIMRWIVTIQFILAVLQLAQISADFKLKLIFLATWCASLFLVWKRPLFCRDCKSFLSLGLWPKHCSTCGTLVNKK